MFHYLQHILIINPNNTLSPMLSQLINDWQQDAFVKVTVFWMQEDQGSLYEQYLQELPDLVLIDGERADWLQTSIPQLLKQLRNWGQETGFRSTLAVLDELSDAHHAMQALMHGADDLLSTQQSQEELKLRLLSHLRRHMDTQQHRQSGLMNHEMLARLVERRLRLAHSPSTATTAYIDASSGLQEAETTDTWGIAYLHLGGLEQYSQHYGALPTKNVFQQLAALFSNILHAPDWAFQLDAHTLAILSTPERLERLIPIVIRHFDSLLPSFYSQEDMEQGFILSKHGDIHHRAHLMRLGVGIISSAVSQPSSLTQLESQGKHLAQQALKHVKYRKSYTLSDKHLLQGYVPPSSPCYETLHKLLLWEADPAIACMLEQALTLQGFQVFCSPTPEEALRLSLEHCFSIILLDPLVNKEGQLTPDWRTLEKLRKIHIHSTIIVTSTLHYPAEALRVGADAYVGKPFNFLRLLELVQP